MVDDAARPRVTVECFAGLSPVLARYWPFVGVLAAARDQVGISAT
jgi:hypothetical protein